MGLWAGGGPEAWAVWEGCGPRGLAVGWCGVKVRARTWAKAQRMVQGMAKVPFNCVVSRLTRRPDLVREVCDFNWEWGPYVSHMWFLLRVMN